MTLEELLSTHKYYIDDDNKNISAIISMLNTKYNLHGKSPKADEILESPKKFLMYNPKTKCIRLVDKSYLAPETTFTDIVRVYTGLPFTINHLFVEVYSTGSPNYWNYAVHKGDVTRYFKLTKLNAWLEEEYVDTSEMIKIEDAYIQNVR